MTISAAVIAFNEEKHIASCLDSVSWADEVVVIDGSSMDDTAKIAKKAGAKVFTIKNDPLMKRMMNYAFDKCTSDWIISVDADEKVTPELREEIKSVLKKGTGYAAYFLPRRNMIFDKWIAHTRWYPDYQLRLFRRGKAKFPAKNVHEELEVKGEIGYLTTDIEHLNYETVEQFIEKLNSYTTYEAEKLIAEGKEVTWTDAIRFPLGEFLSRFFDGKGYLDGLHGLVLSLLQAFYWEVIFAKVWEKQGFWQYGNKNFLEEVAAESRRVSWEFNHWLTRETTSPTKKLVRRIKNKIGKSLSW